MLQLKIDITFQIGRIFTLNFKHEFLYTKIAVQKYFEIFYIWLLKYILEKKKKLDINLLFYNSCNNCYQILGISLVLDIQSQPCYRNLTKSKQWPAPSLSFSMCCYGLALITSPANN